MRLSSIKDQKEIAEQSHGCDNIINEDTEDKRSLIAMENSSFKDIQGAFSETVKFDSSRLDISDDSETKVYEQASYVKDETVRLFECMPKGFENFLESGPYRRVVDYMDYDKMGKAEEKKAEFMMEQKEPQANRARDIEEKSLELQEYFINFDPYTEDNRKKEVRAKANYIRLHQAVQDLSTEIPRRLRELEYYKTIRNKLIANVIRYEKVDSFVEYLIKSIESFIDFNSIMARHSTLATTNSYLMKKYLNRHSTLQEMAEELQNTKDLSKQTHMVLQKTTADLKQELDTVAGKNLNLEQLCYKWASNTSEKIVTYYNMTMGIQNMTRSLMEVRPYTKHNLEKCLSPCDKIEMIGILILDYSDIVKRGGLDKKKIKKRVSKKKSYIFGSQSKK